MSSKNMVYQISKSSSVQPNFNYIKDVYEVCLKEYLIGKISTFESINRGRKILQSEEEVSAYIAFYGAHHYYKLVEAYDALNLSEFNNTHVETISYGCGAATDTSSLISYCYENNISLSIDKIALIEPSPTALNRGIQYIQKSLPSQIFNQLNIKKIYKLIENLEYSDIISNHEVIKLHIFSNVLEINSIDLSRGAGHFR